MKPLCERAMRNESKGTSACLSPMQDKHGRQQPTAQGCAACGRHGISSPCKLGAPLGDAAESAVDCISRGKELLKASRLSGRGATDRPDQEAFDYTERVERFYTIKNVGPRSSTSGCERKRYCIMFNCIGKWPTVK